MQLIQISDTHISSDFPERAADLEKCVRAINGQPSPPELVIHTGDISHNGLAEEYHSARKILDKLSVPYFVMAGNRDKRAELLGEFADDRYELPEQGWVQYAVELNSARLIMADTLCENSNKGQLCEERLHHLENLLLADAVKPVWLFLHHPPYEAVGIPDPYQFDQWTDVENLASLLSGFKNIDRMFCGHVHRFIDGEISAIKASAISCLAGDLRKGEVSDAERKEPIFKILDLPEFHSPK